LLFPTRSRDCFASAANSDSLKYCVRILQFLGCCAYCTTSLLTLNQEIGYEVVYEGQLFFETRN
jgi:hypothetical protein